MLPPPSPEVRIRWLDEQILGILYGLNDVPVGFQRTPRRDGITRRTSHENLYLRIHGTSDATEFRGKLWECLVHQCFRSISKPTKFHIYSLADCNQSFIIEFSDVLHETSGTPQVFGVIGLVSQDQHASLGWDVNLWRFCCVNAHKYGLLDVAEAHSAVGLLQDMASAIRVRQRMIWNEAVILRAAFSDICLPLLRSGSISGIDSLSFKVEARLPASVRYSVQ